MEDQKAILGIGNVSKLLSAAILIFLTGGYIFYNINSLNTYTTTDERTERRLKFEKLSGHYEGIPQSMLTGNQPEVALYPPEWGLGELLYLQKHRIVSRKQGISIRVPKEPDVAAIDPLRLLVDGDLRQLYRCNHN